MSTHSCSTKRGHAVDDEQEPIVDDLEIAAAYAMAQYIAPPPSTPAHAMATDDVNEIDVDDDEENGGSKGDDQDESTKAETEPKSTAADDESDADSDIDLTEALEKMDRDVDAVDDEDDNNNLGGGKSAPQTAHEVDCYHGSVQQVEQVLGASLHVDKTLITPQQTQPAGMIQHFMVEERIMVIRSLGNSPLLLEEGNLLVLRDPEWIPLGKILEVFGPVSQPLYSIRLPEPIDYREGEHKLEEGANPKDANSEDPWSSTGRYTQWVRQHPDTLVHYLPQQAKLVHTHRLLTQRQRGCDASNMHDEEATELDYSDDEKERQAKGRRKGGRGRGGGGGGPPVASATAIPTTTPGGFFTPAHSNSASIPTPPQQHTQPIQEESDTIYYD